MVTWNDFEKIWASTSPLTPYEFSDPNYSQGWNFVGSTPPARQMWDSIQKKNDEKFKYLRDNFGTPNIVTSSSQMTDTEKVYVYMGSEAGWNSGHWYYYDEGTSSWADGGVYNSVAFVTDPTLSIAGQPADAKAVGDALALKADLAGCTFTGNVNVSADLSVTGTSTLAGDVTASSDLSVAGDSALTNLSVSGATALAGTSTAPTPSADDNSTKIATTEYVQTEIKPIETDVTINDKRISNIEKLLQGNLYDYDTDDDTAYTKSVPAGAMPYAGLEKVGGKTVVMNQMIKNDNSSGVVGDTTFTNNGDGSWTVVRTEGIGDNDKRPSTSPYDTFATIAGHKYLITGISSGGTPCFIRCLFGTNFNVSNPTIYTETVSRADSYIVIRSAAPCDFTLRPQIYDLTLMYGAGNEPSTVEEFESMFPADYYEYNDGELLSAGVTEVVSKDANNATLQTIPIPPSIRNLEGYGWSAGSVYNYIDYERKVFVQNVGKITINADNVYEYDSAGTNCTPYCIYKPSGAKAYDSNVVVNGFVPTTWYNPIDNALNIGNITGGYSKPYYIFGFTPTTTLAQAKATLDGEELLYPLTTPIETDISAYLTDDNLINVESGGTLTFPNHNGADYCIPVPSEETYMIDLQEAIQ